MPSPTTDSAPRGCILPIGGAENKVGDRAILRRFVELAGGTHARLAVIPTASEMADTGGNQLRLSTILGGTPLAQTIRRRNASGVPVAGTSAGAAIMPEHMIAGGESGSTPTATGVLLAPGLGLTNRLMIDQHFKQRDRLGRLLSAVSYNPFAVGVGLDEDTALCLGPDGSFEVYGSGAVTIVDPGDLVYSSMDSALPGEPINLIGLNLHILGAGGRFDTTTRYAFAPPRPVPVWDDEVAEDALAITVDETGHRAAGDQNES